MPIDEKSLHTFLLVVYGLPERSLVQLVRASCNFENINHNFSASVGRSMVVSDELWKEGGKGIRRLICYKNDPLKRFNQIAEDWFRLASMRLAQLLPSAYV